jgi:hypothetical protein
VGKPGAARLLGEDRPVALGRSDGLVSFTVRPDPVASVVLK